MGINVSIGYRCYGHDSQFQMLQKCSLSWTSISGCKGYAVNPAQWRVSFTILEIQFLDQLCHLQCWLRVENFSEELAYVFGGVPTSKRYIKKKKKASVASTIFIWISYIVKPSQKKRIVWFFCTRKWRWQFTGNLMNFICQTCLSPSIMWWLFWVKDFFPVFALSSPIFFL